MKRRTVAQWFAITMVGLVFVATAGLIAALIALSNLKESRQRLVDRLDPMLVSIQEYEKGLVNLETSLRGFQLSGNAEFLETYDVGRAQALAAIETFERVGPRVPTVTDEIAAMRAAAKRWSDEFSQPEILRVRNGDRSFDEADARRGKALFDDFRDKATLLQTAVENDRDEARAELTDSAGDVTAIIIIYSAVVLASVLAAALVLQRTTVRPLRSLAGDVRDVAGGNFDRNVTATGAAEVVQVGEDVDAMRARIVSERNELERSNAELEQFAYVASHDLQEPLRKIASFTQMLQRRYGGQLDDRADTYIEFAVDGARRMQDLINDLLAFSRVGRLTDEQEDVDANVLADRAVRALAGMIEESGATVEVGDLPRVRGEAPLLGLVFQNLIGNGIKFRGEEPPHVRVSAERRNGESVFTVSDNGIGIESEYADRIFIIFQRLHPRTTYEGTGIGLAMCRKVIEHHGGKIWLDTDRARGATFHFTLPAID